MHCLAQTPPNEPMVYFDTNVKRLITLYMAYISYSKGLSTSSPRLPGPKWDQKSHTGRGKGKVLAIETEGQIQLNASLLSAWKMRWWQKSLPQAQWLREYRPFPFLQLLLVTLPSSSPSLPVLLGPDPSPLMPSKCWPTLATIRSNPSLRPQLLNHTCRYSTKAYPPTRAKARVSTALSRAQHMPGTPRSVSDEFVYSSSPTARTSRIYALCVPRDNYDPYQTSQRQGSLPRASFCSGCHHTPWPLGKP